jgi:hypothetical protein
MSIDLQIVGAIIWMSIVIQVAHPGFRGGARSRYEVRTGRNKDVAESDLDLSKDRPTKWESVCQRASV